MWHWRVRNDADSGSLTKARLKAEEELAKAAQLRAEQEASFAERLRAEQEAHMAEQLRREQEARPARWAGGSFALVCARCTQTPPQKGPLSSFLVVVC